MYVCVLLLGFCVCVYVCMCVIVRVCIARDTPAQMCHVCVIRPPIRFININKYRYNVVYICMCCVYVLSPIIVRESYCM